MPRRQFLRFFVAVPDVPRLGMARCARDAPVRLERCAPRSPNRHGRALRPQRAEPRVLDHP